MCHLCFTFSSRSLVVSRSWFCTMPGKRKSASAETTPKEDKPRGSGAQAANFRTPRKNPGTVTPPKQDTPSPRLRTPNDDPNSSGNSDMSAVFGAISKNIGLNNSNASSSNVAVANEGGSPSEERNESPEPEKIVRKRILSLPFLVIYIFPGMHPQRDQA